MRLALHCSYGGYLMPKGFVCGSTDRVEKAESLAEWLDTNMDIPSIALTELSEKAVIDKLRNGPKCVRVLEEGTNLTSFYYVKNACSIGERIFLSRIFIVEVDTTKLWMLDEYDGYEAIRYFILSDRNQLVPFVEESEV